VATNRAVREGAGAAAEAEGEEVEEVETVRVWGVVALMMVSPVCRAGVGVSV
jgi:hypothetical protein